MTLSNSSKNFSFVMIGRIISSALQAIFYLIFAAMLQPDSYGNLSYLIALAGTISTISRIGLNYTVTVYQAKNNSELSNQINVLALITTSIASVILLTVNITVSILCFSMSLFLMNIHNLMGLKEYKKYMSIDIIKGILIVVVPILFYFILEIPGILLGMSISYLVCSFHFFKFLHFNTNQFKIITSNYKVLIHNFGVDFSANATKFVDKLIIVPILGFTYTGIYQLNIQILFGLEMLPLALHSFLLSEESSGKKHKKISYLVILASGIVALLVIILGPFFINELFLNYSEGIYSLQIMILSLIPLSIGAILNAKLQAKESTTVGFSAIVRIGSLLILVGILGNLYGLTGLSFAVLISVILNTIVLYALYTRNSRRLP